MTEKLQYWFICMDMTTRDVRNLASFRHSGSIHMNRIYSGNVSVGASVEEGEGTVGAFVVGALVAGALVGGSLMAL